MTATKEHVIWDSEFDIDDYKDYLEEEWPEVTDEEEQYDICREDNEETLECERMNLSVDVGAEIIGIADLGLWYGRRQGYREFGTNLANCLGHTCGDYVKWYVDENGEFMCRDVHHDGVNYYRYRRFKKTLGENSKEKFKALLYDGKATEDDVERYTMKLGDVIAKVYGW